MHGLLEESLRAAPIVKRGEYNYFVHPITDGVPYLEPELLNEVTDRIIEVLEPDFDKILTIEAMGIHIGTALALRTGKPLSIIRKRAYKLPGEVKVDQSTGYSKGELFLNGISKRERLVIIDDVISTGGTLKAVSTAVKSVGAAIVDTVVVIERGDGAQLLQDDGLPVKTLVKIDVDADGVKIIE
ncbi:MAG: hypoxanthine/guanine phosphoribosyltransferase [Methanosarcinales archaeon]|nr:hypoxanthine/guanine phosphoribosyltransferase [ANME-2 cluster archaeon]MDF1531553.1 hypoxanthine/guanine phosphoribosyltransferase [ANME-2 cluster archaeon]MDW7776335.1 hypoxanthine/guanine phosphoribosyltransferase [Methanosarcinales archaeon]